MNTQDSNSNETVNGGKSLENFKGDSVKGEGILGGGKGSITMPTADEEAAGINNSGFDTSVDSTVSYNDDGTVQVINDGTIKVG